MSVQLVRIAIVPVMLAFAACVDQPGGVPPTGPSGGRVLLSSGSGSGGSGGGGGSGGCSGPTVTEQLSGPALNGVVPEGRAQADESQYLCGGSTILTVQVKNVNLPDGTVLSVSLDFTHIGTITLSRQEGTMTANLGHFAVSNDEVRVANAGTVILIGPFFK